MDDGAIGREVRIEPLGPQHDVAAFECGIDSLDAFIRRHAPMAPRQGLSQTWVTVAATGEVLAYHTLAITTVTQAQATARVLKGMPNYDIPCVLLARLAVARRVQGEGLGGLVLEAAMRKALALGRMPRQADGSRGLPLRAMLVHALDAQAAAFYRHQGFESSPTDPLHLLMLLQDIERAFPGK